MGPPGRRADGRPPIAIHDYGYYLAGFLIATVLGTALLAVANAGVIIGLLRVACFIVAFSFPSLTWIAFVHHRRRGEPEPRQGILTALVGGMLATIPPLFVNTLVGVVNPTAASVLTAPLVEELSKAFVLLFVIQEINSRYDGIIYGVTVGMGFAMMENLTYNLQLVTIGPGVDLAVTWGAMNLVRGLGSTIGHAVGVGLVGYAIAAYIDPQRGEGSGRIALAYLAAVGLHAGWNGLLTVAASLSGAATVAAHALVIGTWPMMELGILLWLMERGRAQGDKYIGGGIYHEGVVAMPPPPTGPPVIAPDGRAPPAPQPWYGPPREPAWPPRTSPPPT